MMRWSLGAPGRRALAIRLVALSALLPLPALAGTFTPLYSFTGAADGAVPRRGPILDGVGNLYGTTLYGANDCPDALTFPGIGCGTVYTLPAGGAAVQTLVTFTGPNGAAPNANLTLKGKVLYGTTFQGGASNLGTLFKVNSNGTRFKQLYSFSGLDGANPNSIPRFDANGNIFTTTPYGGPAYTPTTQGFGTLFELTAGGTYISQHPFSGGADGGVPGRSFFDKSGTIFGSTGTGGSCASSTSGCGTVFTFVPTTGVFTTIYTFTGAADGSSPGLAGVDKKGNVFGYTGSGGVGGYGTLFKLLPKNGTYKYMKLWDFTGGADGANPSNAPALTATDELVGTTLYGPVNGSDLGFGTLFSFTKAGGLVTLHTFTGGADGAYPQSTPALDHAGTIYGTAAFGGANIPCNMPGGALISVYGCGVIYSYTP